jgi:hypothetical protein
MRLLKFNDFVKELINTKIFTQLSNKIKGFGDYFIFVDPPGFLHYWGSTDFQNF